ncbi:MAG TPA: nicotinate-nucleotide adenylyltransferase [Pyrinomonadaceae bacterium]|jgi:nicotinate-nucleotide adenylyltransferase|nr:nicotinate-nucleotide adenylyltransferase [Pyrinomonadaceae bacterium]
MGARKRIALYGGTFDPVHSGHLEIARRVSELFEIEKVLFVPAQVAPHKVGRPVTEPIHRYAMLALATQNDPRLLISTFELDAPDRRYTVDTVEHFQRVLGESTELFFIMGADSWSEISTWREWERLLRIVNHIVVTRPGYEVDKTLPSRAARVFFTDAVMKDVSATNIRRLVAAARFDELAELVPEPVAEYIRKYELYRDTNETRLNS